MAENVAAILEAQHERRRAEIAAWEEAMKAWATYWDEEPDDPAESP